MGGPFKTAAGAWRYARQVEAGNGTRHVVFVVSPGTQAYALGYRFSTCAESEREEYARDGAVFVDEPRPDERTLWRRRQAEAKKMQAAGKVAAPLRERAPFAKPETPEARQARLTAARKERARARAYERDRTRPGHALRLRALAEPDPDQR